MLSVMKRFIFDSSETSPAKSLKIRISKSLMSMKAVFIGIAI